MLWKLLSILGGLVLLIASCWIYAFCSGYDAGVADTETRWRDAVGRHGDKGDECDEHF